MKILLVSDSHGNADFLDDLYSLYEKEIVLRLHCGDSELEIDHPLWNHYDTVRGNMDFEENYPSEVINSINGFNYVMVHGHLHGVKNSLQNLVDLAKDNDAHFAFYGHTHIPKVDKIDGVNVINPGSLTLPRGNYKQGSYAILEIKDDKATITYYDSNHFEMFELSQIL